MGGVEPTGEGVEVLSLSSEDKGERLLELEEGH